jgi:hypothetical protein
MKLAISAGMHKKRTQSTPLALTLDGSVLLNVSAGLGSAMVLRVAQALAIKPADLFIGAALNATQRAQALARIDDAAAEAAARIQGEAATIARPRRVKRG